MLGMKKKWYENQLVIIALLVLFFPVGLLLMWKYANWNKAVKWVITGVFALFVISSAFSSKDTKNTTATTEPAAQTQTTNNEPAKPTEPPVVLSEQDQIKKIVTDQVKGQNNMKKDRLKNLEVAEKNSGWNITVQFNADDNLTTNLRKKGIESDMSELYISLFKSGKNIKTVSISAYFPLQDQYGNVNDRVVYASSLDSEEAGKVNWNADQSTLKLSILPGVWTTTMLHPEFR